MQKKRQSDKILLEKQEYMLNWLILAHSNKKCSRDGYFKNISILSNYMFGKACWTQFWKMRASTCTQAVLIKLIPQFARTCEKASNVQHTSNIHNFYR